MNDVTEPRQRVVFGRRHGKALRKVQKHLVDTLLPRIRVSLDGDAVVPGELFPDSAIRTYWLEIGFGAGEHLAWQADQHPDIGIIGCEPFINGVASLLRYIERDGLQNVRIWQEDARDVLTALPTASVASRRASWVEW